MNLYIVPTLDSLRAAGASKPQAVPAAPRQTMPGTSTAHQLLRSCLNEAAVHPYPNCYGCASAITTGLKRAGVNSNIRHH